MCQHESINVFASVVPGDRFRRLDLALRCGDCGVAFEMAAGAAPVTMLKLSIRPKGPSSSHPSVFVSPGMPPEGEPMDLGPIPAGRGAPASQLAVANDIPEIPDDDQ